MAEPSRAAQLAPLAFVVVCGLLLLAGLSWRVSGGDWAVIESPSMGSAAPVGTLILTRPVPIADLGVGDIVTYRPRNEEGKLYTHRVVRVLPDGTLEVKGDINGALDPFPVRDVDLVGQVVAHWKGVGWVVRALPYVVGATLLMTVATKLYVRTRWRSSIRVLAVCLIPAVAALVMRPFVHPILVAVVNDPATGSRASVVSGGVLPTRVTGADGHFVDLLSGQTGSVPVEAVRPGSAMMINGQPNLYGWWLVAVIAVCLLPMLWTLLVGLSPDEDEPT